MRACFLFLTLAATAQICLAGPVLVPAHLVGLQPNTLENIYRLKHLGPHDSPLELSGQFQGDIILTQEQLHYINEVQINPNTVLTNPIYRWPNAVIPYELNGSFTVEEIEKIDFSLFNLEYYTCLRFVKRTTEEDYVSVENPDDGCNSYIGRTGGKQVINLSSEAGCIKFDIIIHEFLHAVGFHHMHCDSDRDNYVHINMDNVPENMKHNFVKVSAEDFSQFGVPYDFTSVMHYEAYAFAIDKSIPTIVSLTGDEIRPNPDTWSWLDVERINQSICKDIQ